MPRYVHADKTKFWDIEKSTDGKSFRVAWGRVGSDGRNVTKKFDNAYACTVEYDSLVSEKLKIGYAVEKAQRTYNFAIKANAALEASLYEAIDDDARWSVYADWLQEAGDVRGEMIALGLAGKQDDVERLAQENADVLWGDAWYLRDDPFAEIKWTPAWNEGKALPVKMAFDYAIGKYGFVDSIALHGLDDEGHAAKALQLLLVTPIGRFVRSISLAAAHEDQFSGASGQPNYERVATAIAHAKPTALRSLDITAGGYQLSWTTSGKLGPLLAAAPHLEELSLELGSIDLGDKLDLPKLRTLRIETGGLARENVVAIAKASWPSLAELVLFFGRPDYGGDATAADVEALLANRFPKLRTLALCNAEIQGDIARAVARSPLVEQLRVLDLSKGTLIDADATPLVDNLSKLAHLERLDLSANYLSPAIEQTFAGALGEAYAGGSRYDEMVSEREQYANEPWAKDATFRYTVGGE